MSKYASYLNAATDAFNNGFVNKARQSECLADVTRAYETLRRELADACLDARTRNDDGSFSMSDACTKVYWDVPSYPHQFNAKHADMIRAAFADRFDDLIANAFALVALRNEVKAAPITPLARTNIVTETETKVKETLRDMIARKTAQFHSGVELVNVFGKLPVRVIPHWVVNEHGTGFVRCFYYMNDRLTSLNVICAVLDATRDEEAK